MKLDDTKEIVVVLNKGNQRILRPGWWSDEIGVRGVMKEDDVMFFAPWAAVTCVLQDIEREGRDGQA